MSYQDYLPTNWMKDRREEDHPLVSLRKQVDSLFDDFGNGFFSGGDDIGVRSNFSETDKEFCITAELPGMTEADVDVSVSGDRIVIKGEKKSEKDEKGGEKGREFHRVERRSGAFQRMMTLPFSIDPETVEAVVKDGVLTVTITKPPEAVAKTTKIKIAQAK
ncbi:Hsp20/alpha crystallin family protein [Roseobacter weihaiensis]|uniref:Hsp20/alpha crystallin family protein n=1 Tax=Roseobacter weihaiensis TaxID=2763262 RepID=UPI001D0B4C0F|nr:Hsp20/alpha crystallin family protein [Roseobacter sp. H9]